MPTRLSEIPIPNDCVIVFDLDDTLIAERDFVRSGFRAIAEKMGAPSLAPTMMEWLAGGERDVIGRAIGASGWTGEKSDLLNLYREHPPELSLAADAEAMFRRLAGRRLGLITDGRSLTQRNKLAALGIAECFQCIVISEELGTEKPNPENYLHVARQLPAEHYWYIGDNLSKDFVAPNALGWTSICLLDDGRNIHPQRFDACPPECLPQFRVKQLD